MQQYSSTFTNKKFKYARDNYEISNSEIKKN